MKRLKLELKQTMDMYSSACKEAISAKNKVNIRQISLLMVVAQISVISLGSQHLDGLYLTKCFAS